VSHRKTVENLFDLSALGHNFLPDYFNSSFTGIQEVLEGTVTEPKNGKGGGG